jgi:hypothetical protein
MSHHVTGVITKADSAKKLAAVIPFKFCHYINQEFVIFPITDDLIDEHLPSPQNFCFSEFVYLSQEFSNILLSASVGKAIMYFETEYFGGEGSQSAIVYENQKIVYGPTKSDIGSVSEALITLGVTVGEFDFDAFESVGLSEVRSSEKLLKLAVKID